MGQEEKRSDVEWRELAEAQRRSGLTQKEWCEREGINYSAYVSYGYRMRQAEGGMVRGWVELSPGSKGRRVNDEEWERIEIKVGTYRVAVPEGFEASELRRVLEVLREC